MAYWAQKTVKMYRIVFLLCSSVLFMNCSDERENSLTLPYYNEASFNPIFISKEANVADSITHVIANFSLFNEDSNLITEKFIEGKIHVANFIFTSCGSICPNMTSNLKLVVDSLAADTNIVFLSFSVTPWIDKPSVLKEYKRLNKINNNNWHFLTGNKNEIYTLARKSYFAEEDIGYSKDSSEFLHTEHFILVDQHKHIRGIYNGTLTLEMHQLIEDIQSLK